MNEQKLLSIIIPIYNVEAYLEKCVNSVRNQTYKNIEIILVDDGSPDKCPEICDNRLVDDRYVFCYFLGENIKEREIAKRFAEEKGLTLVIIPPESEVYECCTSIMECKL